MNTGKTTRRKSTSGEKRFGVLAIVVIAVVIMLAIIFVSTRITIDRGTTGFLELPLVQTTLRAADGTSHIFGARVALELDGSASHDEAFLQNEIHAAISGLSYDDITGFYGMDLLRSAVRERISPYFDEGELVAVYFTDVLSGMPMPSREIDTPTPRRNTVFDAIFGR